MNETFTVSANGSHEVSFSASNIQLLNNTGQIVYVRIGSQQTPDAVSNDMTVLPYSQVSRPISPATKFFAFALGAIQAPTTAAGAIVNAVFDDQPQAPFVTNINQPNVGYVPIWDYALRDIVAAGTLTLITPPAGRQIVVFQLAVVVDNPQDAFVSFQFYQGTTYAGSRKLWDAYLWNLSTPTRTKRDTDIMSWLPHGFPLTAGSALSVKNQDLSNEQFPFIGVHYQIQ